ncbi:helix-turn-helix domain-containing protein [Demetria terragena]|uniref:helix-turn-helix domain-containing protein n=1 Tax=Demetria terragena TaxID=63959 RepID=UPI0012E9E74F|nr:helix-turn-helix domain-containing protein [Demetria terragena]
MNVSLNATSDRLPELNSVAPQTPAELGRALKRRLRAGTGRRFSVAGLARQIGVAQSSMYAYLSGTTLPPSDVLDDLLIAMRVPPAEHRWFATARDHIAATRRHQHTPAPDKLIPRELPPDLAGFVGRQDDLRRLDDIYLDARAGSPGVAVITGPVGVGKTSVAVKWAHDHRDAFPDGQLFLDLHGFSAMPPVSPEHALASLLRSLGVEEQAIPPGVDERTRRLRTALADRRVLLVLDNAVDATQVRPLLPSGPGVFVIVTSRHELAALQVTPGAHQIEVAPLSPDDCRRLLHSHVPTCATDPRTQEVVERCGGLPLALRIAAARMSSKAPGSWLSLVHELDRTLGRFDPEQTDASDRSTLSSSVHRLTPMAAAAFTRLGRAPLVDVDVAHVQALLDCSRGEAKHVLAELAMSHLLEPCTDDR